MRLSQSSIPLSCRYLLTVLLLGTLTSVVKGQSKTVASNFSSVAVAKSNSSPIIRPLSIGDQVPDIVFENVLNYKSKKVRLSDFKGKLVILDMWSIYCTSCIAAFPKMEALQKEFGDKIQILLVNPHDPKYDSEEKIKTTITKNKIRTGFYPTLPIPIHDSILNKYFPHESVPHYIWIDGERNVLAITGLIEISSLNIKRSLEDKKVVNLSFKNDKAFDKTKPLLIDNNGGTSDDFIYRSIFTGYRGGIGFGSGTRRNENKEIIGAYRLNKPLRQLVYEAYYDIINGLSACRVILNVKNPALYGFDYNPAYSYCYDLTIGPIQATNFDFKAYLKDDLKKYFKVSAEKQKRKLRCLIFVKQDKITDLFTRYTESQLDLESTSIKKYIHNYPIHDILNFLEEYIGIPLIDETGIIQNIDLNFPDNLDLSNSKALIDYLKQIGLAIKEEERELEVAVITDR